MAQYNKTKFYWLQLKEDFFEDDAIQWLEEQKPNGRDYAYFYLKLCLKSLKSNGILIRKVGNILIPYDNQKLAELTKMDFDTVTVAMELLKKIGLVQILENGEIYIQQLQDLIGSKSIGAFKKQQQRLLKGQKEDKCPPKIDIDIEIEKEEDIEIEEDINNTNTSSSVNEDEILKTEFEKLWSLYPKKVGKDKSFTKYKKYRTSKGADYCTYEEVLKGLEVYLKYIKQNTWYSPKDGATWFNNRSWNDEYEIVDVPSWVGKEITKEECSPEELEELEAFFKDIG
jgi:predicted phage replisome organizer